MTAPVLDHAADPSGGGQQPRWPVPADEDGRLVALRGYGALDQPRRPDLDAAARLAAYVCGTRAAVVNLIDADRQWQAAVHGTEPVELGRADAPCAHVVVGRDVVWTSDASQDGRFSSSPLVTGPLGSARFYASAPLVTPGGHAIGTVCAFDERAGHELTDEQVELLRAVAGQVVALFELRRLSARMARISRRDPVTGLANRRSLEQAVANAIARAERGLGIPSVVVVALDGFESVAGSLGHATGDAVLRSVAERLTRTARSVDTVARLGGNEFAVVLESTGGPGATAALGRLRDSLADGWAEVVGGPSAVAAVSASLGMATYRPGDGVASLLARADAETYADKARRSDGA